MNAELWSVVGTIVATGLFLVVPGVVYAWYVIEVWIGSRASYEPVMRAVDGGKR